MKIFIGGAWIYANGNMHIGHLASLLPGDVIARYHRLKGDEVCYVSGSDCYGTPITVKAKTTGQSPEDISDHYHQSFIEDFEFLGFSYDSYNKTTAKSHHEFVTAFHKKLYESPYVFEKTEEQLYCPDCDTFLADRMVIGKCPECSAQTKGDQCDACGVILQPEELIDYECSTCHGRPVLKATQHLYIALTSLKDTLESYLLNHPNWRQNAIAFTKRYLKEGLRDRAITRDIDWGIPVPKKGYEHKSIYIWAENVLGYLSACKNVHEFFGKDAQHYYIHGKDNIPFHTIILPALLLAHGDYHLPDSIISSEYVTLEGRKISTSDDYALWIKDLKHFNPDSLRYFFLSKGPEKKDADFSFETFLYANNSELLGVYGNFVNRTLAFIQKRFCGIVPEGQFCESNKTIIEKLYVEIGELIEKGNIRKALYRIIETTRWANKYFDEEQPWITAKTDEKKCQNTLYNCTQLIANLAVILEPFIPFSSQKVFNWLSIQPSWSIKRVSSDIQLPTIEILFERLDKSIIEKEQSKFL